MKIFGTMVMTAVYHFQKSLPLILSVCMNKTFEKFNYFIQDFILSRIRKKHVDVLVKSVH